MGFFLNPDRFSFIFVNTSNTISFQPIWQANLVFKPSNLCTVVALYFHVKYIQA